MDIESPATNLLRICRELGVATIAYSPLGRGMFTSKYKSPNDFEDGDYRKRVAPRFSKENFPKNLVLVDTLTKISERKGCTLGQLSLAWLLNQGEDIIPIPGTKKIKNLEENLAALDVHIMPEEDKEIRDAIGRCEVHGDRYPGAMNSVCFMETPPLGSSLRAEELQSYPRSFEMPISMEGLHSSSMSTDTASKSLPGFESQGMSPGEHLDTDLDDMKDVKFYKYNSNSN